MDRGQSSELPAGKARQPLPGAQRPELADGAARAQPAARGQDADAKQAAYAPWVDGDPRQAWIHGREPTVNLGTQSGPNRGRSQEPWSRAEPLFDGGGPTGGRDTGRPTVEDLLDRLNRVEQESAGLRDRLDAYEERGRYEPAPDAGPSRLASLTRAAGGGWERQRLTPELTAEQIHRIQHHSVVMRGGNGRSFLNPGDGRYQKFAATHQVPEGGFMVLAKPTDIPVWVEGKPGVELGVEIGKNKYSVDQLSDLLAADPLLNNRPDAVVMLAISKAGRNGPHGTPSLAAYVAADLYRDTQGPTSDVWITNGRDLKIAPPSTLDSNRSAVYLDEYGPTDGFILSFDASGSFQGAEDMRPAGTRSGRR